VVVIVGGFYLAADPALYRSGVLLVAPYAQHARVMAAMSAAAEALRLWLGGQLLSMAIVGVFTGIGTWWIGLPAPLALGVFAALMDFVPIIGPFVGAVPALLLALALGQEAVLWTVLLFIVLQQIEGNVVAPIVQRRVAHIPPVLLLFSIVGAGLLFGLPGVIVAAPLTVVVLVLVKQLYVREVLGKETEVPGDDG
jgi:predicted PurR-regulated permease PerM